MSHALRIAVGIALAALVVALGVAPRDLEAQAPERGAAAVPREIDYRTALFESIRDRVHLTASKVPPFPMNDRRLLRPKDWPDTMVIGGVRVVRRMHGLKTGDAVAFERLKKSWPKGLRVIMFYDRVGSKWNTSTAGWGPRYSWNDKRQLTERIWYEPDSTQLITHDYTYYRNGRLLGYSWRKEPRRPKDYVTRSYEYLSEFFDHEGKLIALAYEKMRPGKRDSLYAWMGASVEYDEFRMRSHVLYAKAHPHW